MMTEDTNLLLLAISAFWSSSRWMRSRRQGNNQLGGRYGEVSLYDKTYLLLSFTDNGIELILDASYIA